MAFSFIEIVANRADEFVAFAGESFESLPQKGIGFAGAIDVLSDKRSDALLVGDGDAAVVMFFC